MKVSIAWELLPLKRSKADSGTAAKPGCRL